MEPNETLNSAFAHLKEISNNDLDVLLHLDSPPLTLNSTTEKENFSCARNFAAKVAQNGSMLNFQEEDLLTNTNVHLSKDDDARTTLPEPSQQRYHDSTQIWNLEIPWTKASDSVILTTQEVAQIDLDKSELLNSEEKQSNQRQQEHEQSIEKRAEKSICDSPHLNQHNNETLQFFLSQVKYETLDLASGRGATNYLNTTFEQDFANYENIEVPPLDFDLDQFDSLERDYATNVDKKRQHSTQIETSIIKKQDIPKNIASSCPVPMCVAEKKSIDYTKQNNDPMDYLTLDYSKPMQSTSDYNQMHISDTVNQQHSLDLTSQRLNYSSRYGSLPSTIVANAISLKTTDFDCNIKDVPDKTSHQNGDLPLTIDPNDSNLNMEILEYNEKTVAEKASQQHEQDDESNNLQFNMGNTSTADATMIPSSVKQLYDVIKTQYSDFAFVYALGAQLCQDRVPMDCFVNLKMGLLLSLASIGSNPDRPPIPICAMCNDAYMANYLMTSIGQLAARFVGPTDDVKPPSSAGFRGHTNWIEAGPIILAKGGVFYVGDWSRLKMLRADKLFKDIECTRIAIEKTTHVYPLEAAVWTHWRPLNSNSRDQQTFNKFAKIFGIPIHMDDGNHEGFVNYLLEQSSVRMFESSIDHLSISSDDMRNFLAVISNRTVDLSPEASQLLQKYFVASRIERPDCLTKQAFVVLKQFAESFAKLSFRHEVTKIDAVAAIYMCENFIQNVFGISTNPPPTFEAHNFVGKVDGHMVKFQKWLQTYIDKHYDEE